MTRAFRCGLLGIITATLLLALYDFERGLPAKGILVAAVVTLLLGVVVLLVIHRLIGGRWLS